MNKAVSQEPEKYEERKKAAVKHLECVCRVYKIQYTDGRLFLHEHPQQGASWDEEVVQESFAIDYARP